MNRYDNEPLWHQAPLLQNVKSSIDLEQKLFSKCHRPSLWALKTFCINDPREIFFFWMKKMQFTSFFFLKMCVAVVCAASEQGEREKK